MRKYARFQKVATAVARVGQFAFAQRAFYAGKPANGLRCYRSDAVAAATGQLQPVQNKPTSTPTTQRGSSGQAA